MTQGHTLTVEDFVKTLVVEAAVHGIDMAPGLGLAWCSQEGAAITRATLVGLLGGERPQSWGGTTSSSF